MDLLLPTDPVVLEASYDELYLNFPLFRKTIDENSIRKYEVLHEYERVVRFITSYVKKPKEKLEGGALQCNFFNVRNFVIILAIALVYFVIYVKPTLDAIDFIEPIREKLDSAKQLTVLDIPRDYTEILRNKIVSKYVRETYPNIDVETFKIRLEEAYKYWKPSRSIYDWFFVAGEWTSFFTNVYSTLTRLATQNPIFAGISTSFIALLLAWGLCKEVPDAVAGAPPAAQAQAEASSSGGGVAGAPPAAQAQAEASSSGGGGGGGGGKQRRFSATLPNGSILTLDNYNDNDLNTILNVAAAAQPAPLALLGDVASPLLADAPADAPAGSASTVRRRRGSVARGGMRGGNSRSRSRSRRSRSRRSRSIRSRSRTNQIIKNQFKRFIGYVQKQDNFQLKGLEGGALLKRGLRCISASLGLSIMIILVFVIGIYFASIQVVNIDFETILKLVEHKLIGLLPDFLRDKRANGGSWLAVLREIFAVANAKAYMYIPVDKDFSFGVHPAVGAVIGLLINKVLKAIGDGFNFIFDLPTFIWTQSDTLSTKFMDLYNLCSDFLCEEIPKSKDLVQSIIKSTEKVAEKLNLKEIVPKLPKTKRQIASPLPRNAPPLLSKASQSSKTLVLKDAEPKK